MNLDAPQSLPWYFDPMPECTEPDDPAFPAPLILDEAESLLNAMDWRASAACALIAVEMVAPAWPYLVEDLLGEETPEGLPTAVERALELGWFRLKGNPGTSLITLLGTYEALMAELSIGWMLHRRTNQSDAFLELIEATQSALTAAFDRAPLEANMWTGRGAMGQRMENAPNAVARANLAFQWLTPDDSDITMPYFYDRWWCLCRQRLAFDRFEDIELV